MTMDKLLDCFWIGFEILISLWLIRVAWILWYALDDEEKK